MHTQQHKLQSVQNQALRWASNTHYPDIITSQELHTRYNIQPLNIRRYTQAKKTWEKLRTLQDPLYTNIKNKHETTNANTNHSWWPRSLPIIEGPEPPPLYTARRYIPDDPDRDSDDSED